MELGMLGQNPEPDGGEMVRIHDGDTTKFLDNLWLGRPYLVHQSINMGDTSGDGIGEVAILRTTSDKMNVVVKDPVTLESVSVLGYPVRFAPVKLFSVADINGNGAPEVGLLARDPSDGAQRFDIKDPLSNMLLTRVFFDKALVVQDATVMPDLNNNGSDEVAVLGQRDSDGKLVVVIKDSATGETVQRIGF